MLATHEQRSKLKLTMTVVSLLVIAGIVLLADHLKSRPATTVAAQTVAPATASTQPTTSTSNTSDTGTSATTSQTTSSYKDGSYSASSDYYVPHGDERITVSLTLSNGVITGASIKNSEGDNESARYQQDFASVYKSYVVGKKISGLQLGIIAGASDTTDGFNQALSQIATKAQA